jgi:hypothetical protein
LNAYLKSKSGGREERRGQTAYGRGSRSGGYGRGSYNFESATFDGLPALKRHLSGKTEFFYGTNAVGEIDVDDIQHGHAVIRNGKLVYKRRPGESTPIVNKD